MTDKQINAAIAEACGWTDIRNSGVWHNFAPWGLPPQVKSPKETSSDCISVPNFVPNYCSDLNAMHEALKTLRPDQLWDVAYSLPMETMLGFMATARELAETFLMVIGKWEEPTTEQSSVDQKEIQP